MGQKGFALKNQNSFCIDKNSGIPKSEYLYSFPYCIHLKDVGSNFLLIRNETNFLMKMIFVNVSS